MSRVEIHAADGRHVVVDHEGDLSYVKDKAMEIWEATKEPARPPGPAYGFQAEKDRQWDHQRQPPVRAEVADGR